MSAKSVVDIQVNASDFEKFSKLFDDYSAKLDEMPAAWKELNAAMGDAGTAAQDLAAGFSSAKDALERAGVSAEALSLSLAKAVKFQDALGDASHSANKRMSELAKTAKGLASDIAGMGKWVLRLGAAGVVGGALGGFGLGELTNALYSRGRAAAGVGLSPGRYAAFQAYAQPFLGESALHIAASSTLGYANWVNNQMLGVDSSRAAKMDFGILAIEQLKGAVRNYQAAEKAGKNPGADPNVTAYTSMGGDIEDVRRAILQGGVPALNRVESQYRRNAASMEYDMRPWTDFRNQLTAASMQIGAVFGRELSPLIPEFKKLSIETVDAFASFAKSKEFREGIDDAKKGLESFAGWLRGPDAKKLAENLGLVADEVFAVAEKLKWLVPQPPPASAGTAPRPGMTWSSRLGYWEDPKTGDEYDPTTRKWHKYDSKILDRPLRSAWDWLHDAPKDLRHALASPAAIQAVNAGLSIATGIPLQILNALSSQESGGNAAIVNKTSGALGRYQFMPSTADEYLGSAWTKKYGSTATAGGRANFLGSPAAQQRAALAYLADLEKVATAKHLRGADYIRGIAEGWYGGAGAVGNPNISGGPGYPTTGQYGTQVLERLIRALMLQQSAGTKVSIVNSTAARVAVSANAVATG